MAVASRDCAGGAGCALSALAHDGGAGDTDVLEEAFWSLCIFLNLSCSRAAFCNNVRHP